jgi:hypothetical protein
MYKEGFSLDKLTIRNILYCMGILVFWYPLLALSTQSNKGFINLSSTIISYLNELSHIFTIFLLSIIFVIIVISVFNAKLFLFMYIIIFCDFVYMGLLYVVLDIKGWWEPFSSANSFFYSFFSPILSIKVLTSVFGGTQKERIGEIFLEIFVFAQFILLYFNYDYCSKFKHKYRRC